jgi:NADPH:quinone reductase-like Zn-dependent oxidoreductase
VSFSFPPFHLILTLKLCIVTTTAQAPVWLLNACTALDFLTSEHPKAMSVIGAILITVGSIPAMPAVAAGAGGTILASGAAQAIGAIAVGLGQALGATAASKGTSGEEEGHSKGH